MSAVQTKQWAFWSAPIVERALKFAELREREPVAFTEVGSFGVPAGLGYWALTRHDDCRQVSWDSRLGR